MSHEAIFTTIPVLETEHYLLRGLTLDDVSELFEFMRDKNTMKFITPEPVRTEADMWEEIQAQTENFAKRTEIPWVIEHKWNGELIGKFSLHKLSMWHRKAEMGVIIREAYQQKGVMTEVMENILRFGFDTLGLNRIVGDIFADNKGSERLLKKYGFIEEGVMRQTDFDGDKYHDTVVFSLLKPEYDVLRESGWHNAYWNVSRS